MPGVIFNLDSIYIEFHAGAVPGCIEFMPFSGRPFYIRNKTADREAFLGAFRLSILNKKIEAVAEIILVDNETSFLKACVKEELVGFFAGLPVDWSYPDGDRALGSVKVAWGCIFAEFRSVKHDGIAFIVQPRVHTQLQVWIGKAQALAVPSAEMIGIQAEIVKIGFKEQALAS